MGHFKTICKKCDIVIMQCRCMSETKVIKYDTCDKCEKLTKNLSIDSNKKDLK